MGRPLQGSNRPEGLQPWAMRAGTLENKKPGADRDGSKLSVPLFTSPKELSSTECNLWQNQRKLRIEDEALNAFQCYNK